MFTNPLRRRVLTLAMAAAAPVALLPLSPAAAAAPTPAAPSVAARSVAAPSQAAAFTFTKIEGAAATAAGLTPTVDAFRALLGGVNNGSTPGSQPSGRREINWDGTPDAQSAPNALPKDFFNTVVPRGMVLGGPSGIRFQVSADSDNPTATAVRFGNLNQQYRSLFVPFSPQRLFTPVHTNQTWVRFFEPGSTRPATVNGFGAVFNDADLAGISGIELYDQWGTRLWSQAAPRATTTNGGMSFLGVRTDADIAEVRIVTGNVLPGTSETASRDAVVLDDFLYAEPTPLH